jgi:hypothetical protein
MSDEHMNDKELEAVLREWTPHVPAGQIDRSRVVGAVVSRLGSTRRRRHRRWPFSWIRQNGTNRASERSLAQQPSPIPATNGHTPTVIGRTQIMFSPVKAITAGAIVFALGGVMLIAQPFDQQGNVPGAATDDPTMAPSFFSGTFDMDSSTEPVSERREDGVVERTGESFTVSWDANDPRITGTGTYTLTEADYREGATTLADTGDIGTIWTGVLHIANDEGSWEGVLQHLYHSSSDWSSSSGWLTGTDAYEGLSAYVVWWDVGYEFHGHITAEGPPPVPESLPEG